MFISIIADSLNISLATLVKVFNKNYSLLSIHHSNLGIQFGFLLLASIMAYFFCYKLDGGLSGLWYGSIIGSALNSIFNWMMLLKYQNTKNYNG